MTITRLSTKSQIVIPISLRKRLDLNPGDMVEIDAEGERIIIRKAHSSALKQLEECISDVWKGYDQELNTMREEWDK
jgi:AbrB family looped-hinge helix DNA binding protein